MRGLGAYFAWNSAHEPVQPITRQAAGGLGAYFAWNSAHEPVQPIHGLGDTSVEARLSEEAIQAMIGLRQATGSYVEWAKQVTDIAWQELPKESVLTLVPVTTEELKAARRKAFGSSVSTVGVMWPGPVRLTDQDRIFEGTPYRRALSLAVYSVGDRGAVARPYFVSLATLRGPDDPDGGHALIERQAARFGGELVYVVSTKRPEGTRPSGANFSELFRKIGEMGDASAAPSAPPEPASTWKVAAMLVMGASAAGLLWYGIMEKGK